MVSIVSAKAAQTPPVVSPSATAIAADPAPERPRFFNKQRLSKIYNAAASAALGGAVGVATRLAVFGFSGPPALAIFAGAVATSIVVTAFQRYLDVRAYNKTHQHDKAGYWDFAKTGHSGMHYANRAGWSLFFGVVGGIIGYSLADYFNSGAAPAGPQTPGDNFIKADPLATPGDQVVKVDPVPVDPVVKVDPAPVDPVVKVDPAPVDPVVLPLPLDTRIEQALNEAKELFPDKMSKKLSSVMERIQSGNMRVRVQAIKDLSFAFNNGRYGVDKSIPMGHKLLELAQELAVNKGVKNIQVLHDLGYHSLHGIGMKPNLSQAYDMLSQAKAGGHPLSPPMLNYMQVHKLVPMVR